MDEAFKAAAQALVDSGQQEASRNFRVENDEVVVHVVRRRRGARMPLTEKTAVSFFGSGTVCPTCSGSGDVPIPVDLT